MRSLARTHNRLEQAMNPPRTGTLAVPGATLHYETRGSGPVLLLIPGGAGDAGLYAGMAPELATRYTVVSYDPRGLSRSPLDVPADTPRGDEEVPVWSDDAHRLLELLSPDEEAVVLGCSSGAVVAVDLLARHPERLRRVVAHEPPLLELLEDPAPHRALFAEVRETFRTEGADAAMARLGEGLADGPPRRRPRSPPNCRPRYGRWPSGCTPICRSSWAASCARSPRPYPTSPRSGPWRTSWCRPPGATPAADSRCTDRPRASRSCWEPDSSSSRAATSEPSSPRRSSPTSC